MPRYTASIVADAVAGIIVIVENSGIDGDELGLSVGSVVVEAVFAGVVFGVVLELTFGVGVVVG